MRSAVKFQDQKSTAFVCRCPLSCISWFSLSLACPVNSPFFGLLIAWGCGWALKAIFINYDFAWFDPAKQGMTFKNKEYQQAFDQLNSVADRLQEPVRGQW